MELAEVFALHGKTAIVTGAGRGIGRSIALVFSEAGANGVLAARTAEQLNAVQAEIEARGGHALAVPTDIADEAALDHLVARCIETFGGMEVLVNNAGINPFIVPTEEARISGVDKVFNVNWRGPFLLMQRCGQRMIAQERGGSIVNIITQGSWRGGGPYGAAKAALMRITETVAGEWGQYNIRANCIGPGFIRTDMTRRMWENPERLEAIKSQIPLGRIGEPENIAHTALFLASDAAAFITGHTIWAEGGQGPVSPGMRQVTRPART